MLRPITRLTHAAARPVLSRRRPSTRLTHADSDSQATAEPVVGRPYTVTDASARRPPVVDTFRAAAPSRLHLPRGARAHTQNLVQSCWRPSTSLTHDDST